MKLSLALRKFKLGQEPPARSEWRDRTPAERVLEVERLRRMAVGLTGDPDVTGRREIIGRRQIKR